MLLSRKFTVTIAVLLLAGLTGCGGARKSVTTEPETSPAIEMTVQYGELAQVESGPTQLTSDNYNNGLGSFHPSGDRIAFQSDRDGRWQIYELNLADNAQRALVTSEANDENPVWTPDSSGILFVSDRNGGGKEFARDLYVQYVADGASARLTEDPADDWFPVPVDATSFMFLSERGVAEGTTDFEAKNGLYLGSLTGAPATAITSPDLDPSSPARIAAGKYLLRNASGQLGVFTSESGSFEVVTPETFHCGTVCYNDTRALAVMTAREGDSFGLFLFNPEAKLFQKLDTGEGEVRFPQFSPDGKKILYTKEVGQNFQLFELHLAQ